jgi:glycerol-3-phosphate dehydrogenase subunit C
MRLLVTDEIVELKKKDDNIYPEKTIRRVMDACTDCDSCRFLMDESCLVFPELYRLYDREKKEGKKAGKADLLDLPDLCTLCGLCPCPDIRIDLIRGKTERVSQEGMPLGVRLLANLQLFGRLGGLMPRLVNAILKIEPFARLIKKIARIHPERNFPAVARESFFAWAHRTGLDRKTNQHPKAAYFAGCTAGYLFPEVARATVNVLKHNGISVFVPPQECCGMPTFLEGDETTTLRRVQSNLETFLNAAREGYDLVCSCPTCGFLMKVLLKERAFYSEAYQRSVRAGVDEIKVPDSKAGRTGFACLKKTMYQAILKDDSYFSSLDPLERIALSEKITDLGEYLDRLYWEKRLDRRFGKLEGRMVYYAPCHQREQEIGIPYEKLLHLIPGLSIRRVGGAMDCCGMGGSLGFKKDFHEASIKLGQPLMEKIKKADPEAVITDCLSCRLQFTYALPYPVFHPLELISQSYDIAAGKGQHYT